MTNPVNVRYLCGFTGSNGRLFVTPKKAVLITDFRYLTAAKKMVPADVEIFDQKDGLKKLIGKLKNIGIEEQHITYAAFLSFKKHYPKLILKPISGIVEDMRMIKDEDEMKIIRKAVKIANAAFEKFVKTIKAGQSESDMEWNLLNVSRECGADGFSFPPIIMQ